MTLARSWAFLKLLLKYKNVSFLCTEQILAQFQWEPICFQSM